MKPFYNKHIRQSKQARKHKRYQLLTFFKLSFLIFSPFCYLIEEVCYLIVKLVNFYKIYDYDQHQLSISFHFIILITLIKSMLITQIICAYNANDQKIRVSMTGSQKNLLNSQSKEPVISMSQYIFLFQSYSKFLWNNWGHIAYC